ncbi:MAG: hypothetical protein R3C68_11805 [Myxococcota bacterium]
MIDALVQDRHIDMTAARSLIDTGLFSAQQALQFHLIDAMTAPVNVDAVPPAQPGGYAVSVLDKASRRWRPRGKVAVVPFVGTLVVEGGFPGMPGPSAQASSIVQALEEARIDSEVIGVVLHDSPGGDVLAADLIWRAVKRLAQVKPVIASDGRCRRLGRLLRGFARR